ncbi:MAG: translocation/assembly module TamB [Verrucomicrobia subdivision 3 bacterium]|nr:translocation/assembly module TamB [Limisphaerales bacterium]
MARKRKRIVIAAGAFVSFLLVIIAATPLWLPWVLPAIANRYGASYKSFQRISYSRCRLEGITWTNRNITVRAAHAEVATPTAWLIRLARGDARHYVTVSDWQLTAHAGRSARPRRSPSVFGSVEEMDAAIASLEKWLPSFRLTSGLIRTPGFSAAVPELAWNKGVATAGLQHTQLPGPVAVQARITHGGPWRVSAEYPSLHLKADFGIAAGPSNVVITGLAAMDTNRVSLHAEFGREGMLPRTASLDAPVFNLSRAVLRVGDVSGSAQARWAESSFEINAQGTGSFMTNLPPLQFTLRAHGTTNFAELSQLELNGPGVNATLSKPVHIPFPPGEPPAVLDVAADLSRLPWTNLTGAVRGQVTFTAGTNRFPASGFSITATNLGRDALRIRTLATSGRLLWPRLEVVESSAELENGSKGSFFGHANLEQKTLGHFELRTDDFTWPGREEAPLPLHSITARITAQGPFTNLIYSAGLSAEMRSNRWVRAAHIDVQARGAGRALREATVLAKAGTSTISMACSGTFGATNTLLTVSQLEISKAAISLLNLRVPAEIRIENKPMLRRVRVSPFEIGGAANSSVRISIDSAWPERGVVAMEIQELDTRHFDDLFAPDLLLFDIKEALFQARWNDGPVTGFARVDGSYTGAEPFHASCDLAASADGLIITNLLVWSESSPVLHARGRLPVRMEPSKPEQLVAIPGRDIDLTLGTHPDPAFWDRIARLTGIRVEEPQVQARIVGPWGAPQGELKATIAQVEVRRGDRPLPPVTKVQLAAAFDRENIRVSEAVCEIEGQPIHVEGEVPLRQTARLRETVDWTNAQARVSVASASLAPFAKLYPKLLVPAGTLDLEIAYNRGALSGYIGLTNVSTQPLGELGALREIGARFDLVGTMVLLQEATARLSGEPVSASGFMDVQRLGSRMLPPFHLNVWGTNIALVRQPQTLIRSDFDVAIVRSDTNAPIVSGTAVLRDSFYLTDLEALIPGSVAQPERRPPYFSIETKPFADWRLNLNVAGNQFLKLQTPFLRGTASSDFRLRGTLREPVATGELRVNSGYVEFPFGTLEVKQGVVSLSAEQPFMPQLYLTAQSRRFGYDVTLEVTGPATDPRLQFTSLPPLTSEKIFLMLTAGELPRDEITFTPTQRAQRFAVFVGGRVLRSLGFGGASERLTIRTGEEISESGSQTYDVEYKLSDDWSLVGEYDRFNAFNISLKRRIYSK